GRCSNSRTPAPSNTAARSTWISSSSPASRHCWIVWAPCTPTDFGPAADFARATALSMPSVTNWTVEPGRGPPSGPWWVTQKRPPRAVGAPEGAPPGGNGAAPSCQAPQVVGARRRDMERHAGCRARCGDLDVAREVPIENFGDPVVRVGDVPGERHRHDCAHLGHGSAPSTETSVVVVSFMGSSFLSWWSFSYDRTGARISSVAGGSVRPNRA